MSTLAIPFESSPDQSLEAIFRDLPADIERWPLSSYVRPEQVQEWCLNEQNVEVNEKADAQKRDFLQEKMTRKGFLHYHRYLRKLGIALQGRGLEIGAGNFWLASYLSSFPAIRQIVGVELAGQRIASYRRISLDAFPAASPEKIVYAVGDMHRIDRPDNTFDFVACDAVLHHADNLVAVLRECHRCLKPGGWFVAFREPSLPKLSLKAPVFNANFPENGSAQYYYRDGWRSAFINGRYTNIRLCAFYEYYSFKGVHVGWHLQPLARLALGLAGRIPFPKICIAAQKPLTSDC